MSEKHVNGLEDAFERYYNHFGTNFPLCIGKRCPTDDEMIRLIDECITADAAMPEPQYDPHLDY